mgnify:CR=1 FL=1
MANGDMLRFYTFGGLRIERDGQVIQLPTQKAHDLLGYLLTFRDRPHPRSVLVAVLWPDLPESKARRRLSDTLWRVRRVLDDCVLADDEYIRLNAAFPCRLDVEQFEEAASQSETGTALVEHLEDALALYRGPFLDGLYYDWVLLERERLRGVYLEGLRRLLEHYKQIGDFATSLNIGRRLIAAEPFHEAAHREVMRLYHLLGRDAEAVAQYHRCCQVLSEELNVSPAPETEALYQILNRRVSLSFDLSTVHLPVPASSPAPDLDNLSLVGRDAERAALLDHLETAASGQGGILLLEGETGIGKSRLAREIVEGALWRNIDAIVARVSKDASSSYGLFLSALSPMLTSLRVRQLARLVEPAHLQAAAPLLPSLAKTLTDLPSPLNLPPPQAHERLQEALVALTLGLAHITPWFWVLEDIQEIDAETLSLILRLFPLLRESQGLILLIGRSTELRAASNVWETLQSLDRAGHLPRYKLARLDKDAIGRLVCDLLGKEEAALTTYLMQKSDGVPLYLVETLKVLRDEGYLLPDEDGTWRWSGDTLVALFSHLGENVISHRLSQLSSAAEQVLAAAAVVGANVDFDLLAHVCAFPASGSESGNTDPYLLATDELLHLGFLEETDVDYRFSHEQIRLAAYQRLCPSERRRLHRKLAFSLDDLFPDQLERIAHHFEAAGQRKLAIHYLTRAAERAREIFAHQTALSCYNHLLGLLLPTKNRAAHYDVLRDRAEVLGWIGDRNAQGRDLEEMLRLARTLSDDDRLAKALHLRSEWHRVQGHYEAANEDAQAALAIYRPLGDERARAALLTQIGWNIIYTADRAQAADYFQQALPIYAALDDLLGQINCLSGLINAAELNGDYVLAMSYLKRNLALAKVTKDPIRISRAYHNRGVVHYDLGDLAAALADLGQALKLKETTGDRRSQAITHFYLSVVNTELDDLKTAQAHLDTALDIFRDVKDTSWEGDSLAALGRLALLKDDFTTAENHLKIAYQRCLELGEYSYAVIHLSYLAVTELALKDRKSAWEKSQEAVADLDADLSGVEHPQRIYYNHYRVAKAVRHWAAARTALDKAAKILNERANLISDPYWQEKYRTGLRVNRAITEAVAEQPPPGQLRAHLAQADAPAHRRPELDEMVAVIWTVDVGADDAALLKQEGGDKRHPRVFLRRHRILRLLDEAEAAGALPTVADLAGALDVSSRTIRSDLAALRDQGHIIRTRGSRA